MAEYILITGGAGFIGSHMVLALLRAKKPIIILDNLSNAREEVITDIEKITAQKPIWVKGDIRDENVLNQIFSTHTINAVIHFAGLKSVAESVEKPLDYFAVNVGGSVALLKSMHQYGVKNFIFSSSATVYGNPTALPLTEQSPLQPINPYGLSKLMVEDILKNLAQSDPSWRIAILRYFNPAGADSSGLIGENPLDIPNNLMPVMLRVASGELPALKIYGNDYPTKDGTGIRDYIHVEDLVIAHQKSLDYIKEKNGVAIFNLGRGHGYSVLDMVSAMQKTLGHNRPLPHVLAPRRSGDSAEVWADASLAEKKLNWKAQKDIEAMCQDSWRFYQQYKKLS